MNKVFLFQLNNRELLKSGMDNVHAFHHRLKDESINFNGMEWLFSNSEFFEPICYFSSEKNSDIDDIDLLIDSYRNCDTYANNLCYFDNNLFGEQTVHVTKEFTYKPSWYLNFGDVFFVNNRVFCISKNEKKIAVEVFGAGDVFYKNVLSKLFPNEEVSYFIDMKSSSIEKMAKNAKKIMFEDKMSLESALLIMGKRTKMSYMAEDIIDTFLNKNLNMDMACSCLNKYSCFDKNELFGFFVYGTKGDTNSPASRFIRRISRVDKVVVELSKSIEKGYKNNSTLESKINSFISKIKEGLIDIDKESVVNSFKYRVRKKEVKVNRGSIMDIGSDY